MDTKNTLKLIRQEIKIKGAMFWTVIRIKQFLQLNPSITLGNHQCQVVNDITNIGTCINLGGTSD